MKNKFSQAIVLSMVTLSSMALLTACSSHKESSSADKTPKSSQVTSSSKAKSSSKDSGKTSKSSAKVKESSGSKTESSSAQSSQKASAPSSSSSQAQSSSSKSSSASSSSQSQAPKSSASQSQAPKSSSDSQTSSSQAQAKTDTQVTTVDMDVSAVARGRFDSIAGTWKSSDGSRLVFNNTSLVGDITAQGQATVHNYVHPKDNYQEGSGKYDATLSRDRGDTSGIVGDISFVSKKAAISGPSYEQDTIQVTSTGGTKVYLKESDNMTLPKDVTVTDNQLPIDSGIAESGSYKLTKRTAVKNTPSDTAPVEFYLEAGDQINFDMKVTQDGHSWISYISYSGVRRYVQVD
ncbi:MAG: SH3 domain-containing protein [Streptococcus sp.]|uniref:SH3 domain-containing protein n=1 Tax=unclassified Streptococcus TaxID=2608887 RepID=UPI0008A2C75C|nr:MULTISPECIES: SH3 domain-containing protein [unclassified Streptococcus]MDU6562462.1 SH3 domain-containing protein [Streptococcus sp.]MDU7739822.1 SH3 domain-containing protein [Streptococcus sp.]OFN98944.1 cell surface protein [Streptococcus sp. HMSC078H03]